MGALCQKGPMHTVFISYSSEDKGIAFGVCRALEAGGLTCWLAPRDVMAGRPDSGQISEAIRRARVFVLVLSRNSDGKWNGPLTADCTLSRSRSRTSSLAMILAIFSPWRVVLQLWS